MATLLQTDQQLVQQNELATAADQLLGENMSSVLLQAVHERVCNHHVMKLA